MPENYVPLRLHHIAQLKNAVRRSFDEATDMVRSTKNSCHSMRNPADLKFEIDYYLDTIGVMPDIDKPNRTEFIPTSAEAAYIGRLRVALDRYHALPDETPIKLIADDKDWICDTCVFGSHCSAKSIWTKTEEQIAVRLRQAKKELGLQGVFIIKDKDRKTNGFYAITTMGLLRSILNQTKNVMNLLYFIPEINVEK